MPELPRTAAATAAAAEANKRYATERAVFDPVKLERAARIVRMALERKRLAEADITGATGARE